MADAKEQLRNSKQMPYQVQRYCKFGVQPNGILSFPVAFSVGNSAPLLLLKLPHRRDCGLKLFR